MISAFPSIKGYELAKASILLALLGSTSSPIASNNGYSTANSGNTILSNTNVLVVGDLDK